MKKNKKALQKADAAKNEREMSGSLDDMVIGFVRRFSFPSQSARHVAISCAILLSAVTFLFLVPFVGKAYHIDDPLFLWAAKHIQVAPFDPYGFGINWYGQEEPMWDVMKNPPLVSYYLAIVSLFFGWGEVAIHLAMMIPAVGVIIGTYTIARRLCEQPIQAAMACLATPVFIVSSTTVMSDIPMLSLWVWSVGLWIKGLDDDRPAWLAFSALLMALAALTKYYGIALVPLLLVYSLAKKRSAGIWALYFLVPITALAAYQWHTAGLYGSGLLTAAANFPAMSLSEHYTNSIKVLTGLAFVGGCIAVGLFYAPFVWERMYLLGGGFLTLLAIASLSLFDTIGGFPLQDSSGIRFLIIVQFSIFLVAGIGILILALIDVREHRDAASLLILLWIAGTFVFASLINWTVNARSILPMVPAVAILIARRMDSRRERTPLRRRIQASWALVPAAFLALLAGYADLTSADSGRASAMEIRKYERAAHPIWFQGHWGFQYYMDLMGAKPVDPKQTRHQRGDIVAIPGNNTHTIPVNPRYFVLREEIEIQTCRYLATMNDAVGAGFYSNVKGPLPYAFGHVPPEKYRIWSLVGY